MYKKGDIVWAKFDKYPYWPGRIASEDITKRLQTHKNSTSGYGVLFFGERLEYALIQESNIQKYEPNKHKATEYKEEFEAAVKMVSNCDFPDPELELEDEARMNRRSVSMAKYEEERKRMKCDGEKNDKKKVESKGGVEKETRQSVPVTEGSGVMSEATEDVKTETENSIDEKTGGEGIKEDKTMDVETNEQDVTKSEANDNKNNEETETITKETATEGEDSRNKQLTGDDGLKKAEVKEDGVKKIADDTKSVEKEDESKVKKDSERKDAKNTENVAKKTTDEPPMPLNSQEAKKVETVLENKKEKITKDIEAVVKDDVKKVVDDKLKKETEKENGGEN